MARSNGFGGIGGTGIFGLFGTVVQCNANDNSMYCTLAKFVNTILMMLILLYIMYIVLSFVSSSFKSGRKGGFGFR
jgi:hypothetical protein